MAPDLSFGSAESNVVPLSDTTYAGFKDPNSLRIIQIQRPKALLVLVYPDKLLLSITPSLICLSILVLKDFNSLTHPSQM